MYLFTNDYRYIPCSETNTPIVTTTDLMSRIPTIHSARLATVGSLCNSTVVVRASFRLRPYNALQEIYLYIPAKRGLTFRPSQTCLTTVLTWKWPGCLDVLAPPLGTLRHQLRTRVKYFYTHQLSLVKTVISAADKLTEATHKQASNANNFWHTLDRHTFTLAHIGAGAISKVRGPKIRRKAPEIFFRCPHFWVVPPMWRAHAPRLILTVLLFLSLDYVCLLINGFGERNTE